MMELPQLVVRPDSLFVERHDLHPVRGSSSTRWRAMHPARCAFRKPRARRRAVAMGHDGNRGAPASTTPTAVMLTILRTVDDGVRMWTGDAAPSNIPPTVMPL